MIEIDRRTAERLRSLVEALVMTPPDDEVIEQMPIELREAIEEVSAVELVKLDRALQ